ncbi:hypothetical protein, partial [Chromohalobacter japonicus]|uniref:hypothetical protein n=1 Tax=Chromohalobacter japonicus TaxID=223900 RepID=UPI001C37B72E
MIGRDWHPYLSKRPHELPDRLLKSGSGSKKKEQSGLRVPDGRLARKAYSTESAVIVKALAEVTIADIALDGGDTRGLPRCGA